MTRYEIDPANFTDSQWEELYNASTIMPRSYEARHTAKPFRRPRRYIELAIQNLTNRADEVRELHNEPAWAEDLRAAALHLRELIGPERLTKTQARARLYDLLTSDIYTDAPEYEDRVMEVHALLGVVFTSPVAKPRQRVCQCCGAREGQYHHDPGYRDQIVSLTRSRARKRLECQFCYRGLQGLEGGAK